MKLNLKNPLVFFDLETTGTNINSDRIVEICYLKVYPNGNEEAKTLRINPEMHIPEQASAVHGIYDEDVKDCPTFKDVAKKMKSIQFGIFDTVQTSAVFSILEIGAKGTCIPTVERFSPITRSDSFSITA